MALDLFKLKDTYKFSCIKIILYDRQRIFINFMLILNRFIILKALSNLELLSYEESEQNVNAHFINWKETLNIAWTEEEN
jgi:hypothetical protein